MVLLEHSNSLSHSIAAFFTLFTVTDFSDQPDIFFVILNPFLCLNAVLFAWFYECSTSWLAIRTHLVTTGFSRILSNKKLAVSETVHNVASLCSSATLHCTRVHSWCLGKINNLSSTSIVSTKQLLLRRSSVNGSRGFAGSHNFPRGNFLLKHFSSSI